MDAIDSNVTAAFRHIERAVTDGCSLWAKCADSRCDLEVVRPGKVQCSDFCGDVSSSLKTVNTFETGEA